MDDEDLQQLWESLKPLHLRRPDLFQGAVELLAPWPDRKPLPADHPRPQIPGATIDSDAPGPVKRLGPHTDDVLPLSECARMVREARTRIQQNRYQTYVRRWCELRRVRCLKPAA